MVANCLLIKWNGFKKVNEWLASADKAETTSSFNNLKLKGNAMVEKGGDNQ